MKEIEMVKWTKKFETGNIKIDLQHKRLIEMINDLNQDISKERHKTVEMFSDSITDAIEYVHNHFKYEEHFMTEHKYVGLRAHRELHHKFIAQLGHIVHDYENGSMAALVKFADYLKDWLLDHIVEVDRGMVAAIKQCNANT